MSNTGFASTDISARVRDAVEKIARNVLREEGVSYRYGTVTALDYTNGTVDVQYANGGVSVPVRVLGIQPTQVGQVVQVVSKKGDHFINGVVGATGIVGGGSGALVAPVLQLRSFNEALVGDWDAVTNAVAYEFQVADNVNFLGNGVFTYQTGTTQYTFPSDEFSTDYYARVRALDNSTPPQAGPWSNTIGPLSPTEPAAGGGGGGGGGGTPSDGIVPADSPDVEIDPGIGYLQANWERDTVNADAVAYEVHISKVSNFSPSGVTLYDITGGTTMFIRTEADGTPLQYDTNYYVRIFAFDADGKATTPGAQAIAQIDRVETADAGQIGIGNIGDGAVPSSSPNVKAVTPGIGYLFVTWDHIVNVDPISYELHVSTTNNFNPTSNTKVGDTPSNFFFIREQGPGAGGAPLDYATTYYIKIIAYDVDGYANSFGGQGSGSSIRAFAEDIEVDVGGGNLLPYSSCEDGTRGWNFQGTTTTEQFATADAPHGEFVWKGTRGAGSANLRLVKSALPKVVGPAKVTGSQYIMEPSTNTGTDGRAFFMLRDPVTTATLAASVDIGVLDAWKRVSYTWNVPDDGNEYTQLYLGANSSGDEGDILYVDAIQLEFGDIATAYSPRQEDLLNESVTTEAIVDAAIAEAKIALNAVTTTKIADSAVQEVKLDTDSVSNRTVQNDAIDTAQIVNAAVLEGKIANNAVTNVKIIDGAVSTAKIVNDAITNAKMANNSVNTAQIVADAVTNAQLAINSVDTAQIVNDAINNAKLAPDSVDTEQIVADAITNAELAINSVDTAQIVADAITNAKLASNSVNTAQIVNDAITNLKMAVNSVDTVQIVDDAINNAKIGANAVDTAQIVNDAITNLKMAVNSVDTAQIVTDAITNAKLAANSVDTAQIVAAAITNAKVASNAIDTANIVNNAITNAKVGSAAIDTANIVDAAITSAKFGAEFGAGNLLTNGSFEDGLNGWSTGNVVSDDTHVFHGGLGVKGTAGGSSISFEQNLPVVGGQTYTFSYYVRAAPGVSGRTSTCRIHFYGGVTESNTATITPTLSDEWLRATHTSTAPEGSTNADVRIQIQTPTPTAGEVFYFDAAQFEIGDVVTGFAPRHDEILPGTVGTTEIAAAAITTAKIQTAAITTALIQDAAIENAKIDNAAISTAKIQNAAITNALIQDAAIDSAKIQNAAITNAKIQNAAITNAKIDDAAITTAKIQTAAITTALIDDAAITTAKIGLAQVDTAQIANAAIETAKIDTAAITNVKIANAAVDNAKIANASISTAKIQDAAINNAKIANLAVDTAQIQDAAIETAKIDTAAITNAKIANAAISTAQIQDAAIITAKIDTAAITNAKIANAAVDTAQIAAAAIQTAQIDNAAITNAKIANLAVDAAKIQDAAIETAKIDNAAITNAKIANLAVDNAKIANASISTAKIQDAAIETAKIDNAAITNAKIANAAVDTAQIQSAAITTALINNAAITNAKIANAAVDTAQIANAAITNAQIDNAAISSAKIQDAAIVTAKIDDAAITSAKIQDLAVGTAKIGADAITLEKLESLVRASSAMTFSNGFEPYEIGEWTPDAGNTIVSSPDHYSGTAAGLITSTLTAPSSGGVTDGVYIRVDERIALAFAAKRIRVSFFAKTPVSNASSEFAVAYSTSDTGNSGWNRFTPTSSWVVYEFLYDVPAPGGGGDDYLGIWGDTSGAGRGVLIDSVNVEVLSPQITTANVDAWIGAAAIDTAYIANAAVGTAQIENAAITNAKVANAAIDSAQIQDAAITNAKVGTAAIDTANIQSAAITTALIGNAAITNAKIANAAVGSAEIQNAAITSAKIQNLAVGNAQIQDAAINSAKIANAAIGTANIQTAAITSATIADAAIDSAKIVNAAVTNAKIADAAISSAKIQNLSVGTAKIADGAISNAKIGNAQITNAKIQSLSAGKITSGTITSQLITLEGSSGRIRSSNYTSTSGWQIDGNGNAVFNSATIRGTLVGVGGTFSGNLSAAGGTFTGNLSAAGGTFSGNLSAAGGTFSGDLVAAKGTFSGSLSAASGTFSGNLSAAGGTFKGELQAAKGTFAGELSGATVIGGNIIMGSSRTSNERIQLYNSGDLGLIDFYSGGNLVGRVRSVGSGLYLQGLGFGNGVEVNGSSVTIRSNDYPSFYESPNYHEFTTYGTRAFRMSRSGDNSYLYGYGVDDYIRFDNSRNTFSVILGYTEEITCGNSGFLVPNVYDTTSSATNPDVRVLSSGRMIRYTSSELTKRNIVKFRGSGEDTHSVLDLTPKMFDVMEGSITDLDSYKLTGERILGLTYEDVLENFPNAAIKAKPGENGIGSYDSKPIVAGIIAELQNLNERILELEALLPEE